MNINIVSVGKFGRSALADLFYDYIKKIGWKVSLVELEPKTSNNLDLKKKKELEAAFMLKYIDKSAKIIVLDEYGKQFRSKEFSALLNNFAINGDSNVIFVIGGADGLADEILNMAHHKMSLSKMTLPHLMVRVILAEQLYRGYSIINNHPYHRE
ncbi:MAG: 23S rRNA (pseudouridine(1915)-N(3))-methyltransferase RlmH [Rickettsiales bacterium]|nr:23S rRNA (pseudouridine(1915)-N(3))-methyltransferase RlmH [Rickettsiales bacterium]